jgi:NADPH2:quinone reductase
MRAVVLHEFGSPSRLMPEDVPAPTAETGQALIRVAAASVVFIDTQLRAGRSPNPAYQPALPIVLGNGVGGTVIAVGDGVDDSLIGREFVATTGGSGGYAELAAVSVTDMVPIPPGVSMIDAVALLADGRTAIGLTRLARPRRGERVLVEAAGGGVGSLLVQLAVATGAQVIGAASDGRKRELARQLGAQSTVDYTAAGWAERVGPVDLVFDSVGGEIGRRALGLVRDGGRFCVMGAASGAMTLPDEAELRARDIELVSLRGISPAQLPDLTRAALDAAAAGTLRPTIGQQIPLERASEAHAAIEARATLGKTLLIP